jgi:hypothetical protein
MIFTSVSAYVDAMMQVWSIWGQDKLAIGAHLQAMQTCLKAMTGFIGMILVNDQQQIQTTQTSNCRCLIYERPYYKQMTCN